MSHRIKPHPTECIFVCVCVFTSRNLKATVEWTCNEFNSTTTASGSLNWCLNIQQIKMSQQRRKVALLKSHYGRCSKRSLGFVMYTWLYLAFTHLTWSEESHHAHSYECVWGEPSNDSYTAMAAIKREVGGLRVGCGWLWRWIGCGFVRFLNSWNLRF
jgi:hypothetical protein